MVSRNPGPPPEWELRFVERLAGVIQDLTRSVAHSREQSEENTSRLVDALKDHAVALVKSAEASDRHSRNLVMATWALVAVTVALVVVGFLQIRILLTN